MRFSIILFSVFLSTTVLAQNDLTLRNQTLVWYRGFIECRLNASWSVSVHVDERRYVFPDRRHQRLFPEVFVTRKLKKNAEVSGGAWMFNIFVPGDPFEAVQYDLREWRLYGSLTKKYALSRGSLRWRLEAEWRMFLDPVAESHFDGPVQLEIYRQRFLFGYRIPISPSWNFDVSEELFLNLVSNRGGVSFFDQNRISLRFAYSAGKHVETMVGMLHWFQPTLTPREYFSRYIMEVGIKYSFRLKPEN